MTKGLNKRCSAQFFRQLSLLCKAGIPLETIAKQLENGPMRERARQLRAYLARGMALAEAGRRLGLFSELDARLMRMAAIGGVSCSVIEHLAQRDEKAAHRQARIKSQLVLPACVFILALALKPLPALVAGELTGTHYLAGLILPLLLVGFIWQCLPLLPNLLRPQPIIGPTYHWLEFQVPWLGRWNRRRAVCDWFRWLGLLYRAGVPINDALDAANSSIVNARFERVARNAARCLQAGQPLVHALKPIAKISPLGQEMLLVGDAAGKLDDMLLHFVELESANIALHDEHVADWLPRTCYIAVVVWLLS